MQDLVVMRFAIDWDDDGFFNYESVEGDDLNLFPAPLSLSEVDVSPALGSSVVRKGLLTYWGLNAWEITSDQTSQALFHNPARNYDALLPVESAGASSANVSADTGGSSTQALGDAGSGNVRVAQSFSTLPSPVAHIIGFEIYFDTNVGSPSGPVIWELRTDSGSTTPSQTKIAWGEFTPTPNANNTVTISPVYSQAAIVWLVLVHKNPSSGNYYRVRYNPSGVYANGVLKTDTADARTWAGLGGTNDLRCTLLKPAKDDHDKIAQKLVLTQPTTIDKIEFYGATRDASGTVFTVRIETDNAGEPSGTLAHANAIGNTANLPGSGVQEVVLHYGYIKLSVDFTDFTVAAGTYWVVINHASANDLAYTMTDAQKRLSSSLLMATYDTTPGTWRVLDRNLVFTLYGQPSATAHGRFGLANDGVVDDVPVTADTTYTWSVRIRGISSYAGDDVTFEVRDQDDNVLGTLTDTLPGDGSWARFAVTATTEPGSTHVYLFVGIEDVSAIIQVTGFMMLPGDNSQPGFNAGHPTNLYDNITLPSVAAGGVMTARWNSGRANPEDIMFSEGEAELILNNSDKRYSPEYASSPLFGYIKPNLRLTIALLNPATDEYSIMWSGWTGPIQPAIGADTGTRQATLPVTQGKYRLDATPLRYPITQNQRTDEIIDGILVGGWFSAATPFITILDRSRLDENAFLHDLDDIRTTEEGDSIFPFAGENWVTGETAASDAIGNVLEVERGYTWIDRSGLFVFRNRHYYGSDAIPDYTLSVDTEANSAKYRYGDEIYNSVKVTYYPKETLDDIVLWESKETITLKRGEQKTIVAKFEYEEGSKITAIAINGFDAATNPSLITAVNAAGTSVVSQVSRSASLRNGEGVVTLRNNSKFTITVTLTLKGDAVTSAGSVAVDVSDESSITDHGLFSHPALNLKEVTDEETAEDLGNFILSRFKEPFGTFDTLHIESRDETWLGRIIGITHGSLLELSETQTGATDKLLIVVGEEMSWRPGHLIVDYTLVRPEIPAPWILGTSALDVDTYLGY